MIRKLYTAGLVLGMLVSFCEPTHTAMLGRGFMSRMRTTIMQSIKKTERQRVTLAGKALYGGAALGAIGAGIEIGGHLNNSKKVKRAGHYLGFGSIAIGLGGIAIGGPIAMAFQFPGAISTIIGSSALTHSYFLAKNAYTKRTVKPIAQDNYCKNEPSLTQCGESGEEDNYKNAPPVSQFGENNKEADSCNNSCDGDSRETECGTCP